MLTFTLPHDRETVGVAIMVCALIWMIVLSVIDHANDLRKDKEL